MVKNRISINNVNISHILLLLYNSNMSSHSKNISDHTQGVLLHLLKSIAPLMIEQNIQLNQVQELSKIALLETAKQQLKANGQKITHSQISLMTGIHRKDIKRLEELDGDSSDKLSTVPISAQLLSDWLGLPEFQNPNGQPKTLPLESENDICLGYLIKKATKGNIATGSVIKDLEAKQLISIENGQYQLNTEAIISSQPKEDKLNFLARNAGTLLTAAIDNILSEQPPHLERAVFHDGLTEQDIIELREEFEPQCMALLTDINKTALKRKQDNQQHLKDAHSRMHLGMVYYAKNDDV